MYCEDIVMSLEELEDIKTYHEVKSQNQETFPLEMVEKLILSDESKIRIIREYRGYSLARLAKLIGISEAYLSQIETNKRKGGIDLYHELSKALDVDIELLI